MDMIFNSLLRHSGNPGSTYRGLDQAIVLVTLQFNFLTLARLPDFYHKRDVNILSPASTPIALNTFQSNQSLSVMASDVNRPPTPLYGFKVYTITTGADTEITSQSNKNEHGQRKSVKFKVDSTSLQAISDYFRASFHFNNKFKHKIVFKDDDPDALRVWFIYLHAYAERGIVVNGELKVTRKVRRRLFQCPCVRSTGVPRLWNIVNAADKYLLDLTILKGFFTTWFHRNVNLDDQVVDLDLIRNLVHLCYFFDHVDGFAAVTKYLVYNSTEPMTEILQSGKEWEHQHLYIPELDGKEILSSPCNDDF